MTFALRFLTLWLLLTSTACLESLFIANKFCNRVPDDMWSAVEPSGAASPFVVHRSGSRETAQNHQSIHCSASKDLGAINLCEGIVNINSSHETKYYLEKRQNLERVEAAKNQRFSFLRVFSFKLSEMRRKDVFL